MARTPDQPPSTAKSRRRQAELLGAAQRAFEERGYVDTSVSDIVRVAGGSRASFYSYFTSKDDVLSVLVSEIRSRFAASLETALIQRRQRRPDPDGLDPRLTAIALGGMVEDLARGRYLFGQDIDDEEAVHTLAVLWARGIGVPTR